MAKQSDSRMVAELLKCLGNELHKLPIDTTHMVRKYNSKKSKTSAIIPIHKKIYMKRCKNYTAIIFLCRAYKIFANLVTTRLKNYAE